MPTDTKLQHKPTIQATKAKQTPVSASIPTQSVKPAAPIPSFDLMPDTAFIRVAQLVQSSKRPTTPAPLAYSEPTYWRKIEDGTLPKPIKLSKRVSAQKVGDIRRVMAALEAGASIDAQRELVKQIHAARNQVAVG